MSPSDTSSCRAAARRRSPTTPRIRHPTRAAMPKNTSTGIISSTILRLDLMLAVPSGPLSGAPLGDRSSPDAQRPPRRPSPRGSGQRLATPVDGGRACEAPASQTILGASAMDRPSGHPGRDGGEHPPTGTGVVVMMTRHDRAATTTARDSVVASTAYVVGGTIVCFVAGPLGSGGDVVVDRARSWQRGRQRSGASTR